MTAAAVTFARRLAAIAVPVLIALAASTAGAAGPGAKVRVSSMPQSVFQGEIVNDHQTDSLERTGLSAAKTTGLRGPAPYEAA